MLEDDVRQLLARLAPGRKLGDLTAVAAGEMQGTYTKGSVGAYVEGLFGVASNSDQGPDLPDLGIEIKSVPLKKSGRRLAAKERTYITAIDYTQVRDEAFEGSPLDLKTRRTAFVFYRWERGVPISDFEVAGAFLHQRSDLEEAALRAAHAHVQRMVASCRAHEISEGDTRVVGAATKDSRARDIAQPCGPATARRRAFAYRASYTTQLWRAAKSRTALVEAPEGPDRIVARAEDILARHRGRSVDDLCRTYRPAVSPAAKGRASLATRALLRDEQVEPSLSNIGVTIRTIRVRRDTGRPFEDISFPAFHPADLVVGDDLLSRRPMDFEESDLIELVSSMFFVVLEAGAGDGVGDARLVGGFGWKPTPEEVDTMSAEFALLRDSFLRSRPEDRPAASETRILHVRPHGRDGDDKLALPDGRPFVRSSFWLNKDFVGDLVGRHLR